MREYQILKTGEVAKVLECSIGHVNRMIDRGELPGWRLPGSKQRRVTRDALKGFMVANGYPLALLEGRFPATTQR